MTTLASVYNKRTAKDLAGIRVRTLKELSNGHAVIPVGTVLEITDKRRGFALLTDCCAECGVRVYITEVAPQDVEFADPDTGRINAKL